jgi:hypothetical protein
MVKERRVVVVDDNIHEARRRARELAEDPECAEAVPLSFDDAFDFPYRPGDVLAVDGHDARPLSDPARARLVGRLVGRDEKFVGVTLIEHVRRHHPSGSVTVVLLTNFSADGALALRIQRAGCDFRFDKSVVEDPSLLREAVLRPAEHPELSERDLGVDEYVETVAKRAWLLLGRAPLRPTELWRSHPYTHHLRERQSMATGAPDAAALDRELAGLDGAIMRALLSHQPQEELRRLSLERQARGPALARIVRALGFTKLPTGGHPRPSVRLTEVAALLRAWHGHQPPPP